MGPLPKPKSTRARRGRSDNSSPKTRRKPTLSKAATAATKGNREPTLSPDARQAFCTDAAAETLKAIHRALDHVQSTSIVCSAALRDEGTFIGQEVAGCLRRNVSDAIDKQMELIDGLLGREKTYANDDDEVNE